MAQKNKQTISKPRAKHVNDILVSKVGGAHEPKSGPHQKRARQKEQLRQELADE